VRLSADGTLRLSPSDLANHLACPHLTQLELKVQREGLKRPVLEDAYGSLIREKGNLHELAYLEQLGVAGKRVLRMPTYEDEGFDSETARQATEEAIRAGEADVVYQAYLSDGTWRGFADFLERRTDGTYEPVDTKLARSAKPLHILQLCFYAEQLERIQGQLPEEVHASLGVSCGRVFGPRTTSLSSGGRGSGFSVLWAGEKRVTVPCGDSHRRIRGLVSTARSATFGISATSGASTTITSCSSPGLGDGTRRRLPQMALRRSPSSGRRPP